MSLYVGNLLKNVKMEEMKEIFNKIGSCKIDLKDGYAIIDYREYCDAVRALIDLNQTEICNEILRLNGLKINLKKIRTPVSVWVTLTVWVSSTAP